MLSCTSGLARTCGLSLAAEGPWCRAARAELGLPDCPGTTSGELRAGMDSADPVTDTGLWRGVGVLLELQPARRVVALAVGVMVVVGGGGGGGGGCCG